MHCSCPLAACHKAFQVAGNKQGKWAEELKQVLFRKFLFLSFSQTKPCFCGLGHFRSMVALATMFTGPTVRTGGWFQGSC